MNDRSAVDAGRPARSLEQPASDDATADLLWRTHDIFDERYRKSASALIAVARVLERRHPLGGGEDEFLAWYAEAAAARPALFTRVWTDPSAYFWVRMAYQLVAACLGTARLAPLGDAYCRAIAAPDPRHALAAHLDGFKGFVLAMHVLARSECRFARPFRTTLPFAIPATRLVLEGEGAVAISRLARRRLDLVHEPARWEGASDRGAAAIAPPVFEDAAAASDEASRGAVATTMTVALAASRSAAPRAVRVVEYPEVSHAGARIALRPAAFHLAGLDFAGPALAAGLDFQLRHRASIARTLAVMQLHHRASFLQFRHVMRTVALKPRGSGTYTNISHSDLPGAFVASVVANPYELADTFIHELHHNRLFFVEERGPFFEDGSDALGANRHYSPWRDDPRPLHGLFHAVYVSIPVLQFWLHVHATAALDDGTAAYAVDRILRGIAQLELGVGELERSARFSAFGRSLFDRMKADVGELRHQIACVCNLPADAAALVCREDGTIEPETSKLSGRALTVREAVAEHVRRFSPLASSANG